MFKLMFEIDLLLKSIDLVFNYLNYDCYVEVTIRFEFHLEHSNFGTDMKCMYR